jgi:hypothetical protein
MINWEGGLFKGIGMVHKNPAGRPKRMQELGYKAVTVYLKRPVANVLRLYSQNKKKSQGDVIRELLEGLLRREGLIE